MPLTARRRATRQADGLAPCRSTSRAPGSSRTPTRRRLSRESHAVRAAAQRRSADVLAEDHHLQRAAEAARKHQRFQRETTLQIADALARRVAHALGESEAQEEVGLVEDAERPKPRAFGRPPDGREIDVGGDVALARKGMKAVRAAMKSGKYDVVIVDEVNTAVAAGLFPVGELLALMDEKPSHVEMIITGRGAHKRVLARADLVTEMRDIKHYFRKGIKARRGIEW